MERFDNASAKVACRRSAALGAGLGLILVATACGGEGSASAAWIPEVSGGLSTHTVADAGLLTPEAVLHDTEADVYLVSNANGTGQDRNGSGFISRLSPNGKVKELRWIAGGRDGVTLNAPKGMAVRGDTLFVADVDCVRLFHRKRGVPEGSICPSGATALGDMAVDQDGVVYVTDRGTATGDTRTGAVYTITPDGTTKVVADGDDLPQPVGIAASRRGVFVASWAAGRVAQLTPDGPRGVVRAGNAHLGGIVFTRDGSFLFSNQADSTVLIVKAKEGGAKGDMFTLVRGAPGAGDLGYDARRDRVLIPLPSLNRLLFVDLGSG